MRPTNSTDTRHQHGWSLIEMVAVIAVIAILSAAIASLLIPEIRQSRRNRERRLLEMIATNLVTYVKKERRIPGADDWAQCVASVSGWLTNEILYNVRFQPRVYWIDPEIRVGPNEDEGSLPYEQDAEGSLQPEGVRILLISSLGPPLPDSIQSGEAPSEEGFEEVWQLVEGQVPNSWGWNGDPEDLLVQRIYLECLFHRVTFNVLGSYLPSYAVDGSETKVVEGPALTRWFLENTVIDLYDHEGRLILKHVVKEDTAFTYTGTEWANDVNLPPVPEWVTAQELQAIADMFVIAKSNPHAKFGTTPADVYQAIQQYFEAYLAWAQDGFPTKGNASSYQAVRKAQQDLAQKTSYLIFKIYDAGSAGSDQDGGDASQGDGDGHGKGKGNQ